MTTGVARTHDVRQYNRILVLAVEVAQKQTRAKRLEDRLEWILARWPRGLKHECTGKDERRACTEAWPREPKRWCAACRCSAWLVACYERLAPPAWRVPVPDRATGPVIVRVHVDAGTVPGQAMPGQAQTPRLRKDGVCMKCKGLGMTNEASVMRRTVCPACGGSGGRRHAN